MKTIFVCLILSLSINIYGQGIINSNGYIINSGVTYITIYNGSLNNNGTWTKSSEVISFTGTIASELKGSTSSYHNIQIGNIGGITLNTSSANTCDNLSINASAVFNIASTSKFTVNNTLTNNAGTSGLIIRSNDLGSGSLVSSTANVNVTVEQYQTDAPSTPLALYYHMVSVPISDATAAVFKFTGIQTYLYSYNSVTPAWLNIKTSTTALNAGNGYLLNYHQVDGARTSIYAGTLNTGNISPTLNSTANRYHLVGNPYPCAINWDGAGWTKTNISETYYLWLPIVGSYGTYTTTGAISVNGLTNIISSGQGFLVYSAIGSPALTIGNASKIHNNSILKSAYIEPPSIKLHISNNTNLFSDETVILFSSQATTGYDTDFDAVKMFTLNSESSQLYTTSDTMNLVVNALPFNYKDSIPVFFKCNKVLLPAPEAPNKPTTGVSITHLARKLKSPWTR